jgi:hypothetical protein
LTVAVLFVVAASQLAVLAKPTPGVLKMKSTPTQGVLTMKAGRCTFSLLDSAGVKPLKGSSFLLSSAENGRAIVKMKANAAGKCIFNVAVGRYILTVDGKKLAVIDVAKTAKIVECRVVVPEKGMLVGGDEGDLPKKPLLSKGVVIGGVGVLVAGTTLAIIENNDDGGGSKSGSN